MKKSLRLLLTLSLAFGFAAKGGTPLFGMEFDPSADEMPNKSESITPQAKIHLSVDNKDITDKELRRLIKHLPDLVYLNLEGCAKITTKGVIHIITHCPKIKILNLSNCSNVTNTALKSLERGLPELISLNMSNCYKIHAEEIGLRIALLALHHPKLKTLCLSGCIGLGNVDLLISTISKFCPNLEDLDLSRCNLGNDR